jgi:hypothetical protein
MILINLLGTKHSDLNLEWEVNEILHSHRSFRHADFSFHVERSEELPFIIEGIADEGGIRFSFSENEAVLQLGDGEHELEVQSIPGAPDHVRVHYHGRIYDSRQAFTKSTDVLKPENLYGIISLALESQDSLDDAETDDSRENLLLLTDFGKRKMREALALFRLVTEAVLTPEVRRSGDLASVLAALDFPLKAGSGRKKPAARKKAARGSRGKKKPGKAAKKKRAKKGAKKTAKKKAKKTKKKTDRKKKTRGK